MSELIYSEEWSLNLERAYDEYMGNLWEAIDDGYPIDETGQYFCGCEVCERRASWTYLFKHVILAYRDGSLQLEDEGDDHNERLVLPL